MTRSEENRASKQIHEGQLARGRSISIRRGLDIALSGAPAQSISDGTQVRSVALLGADFPDVRPVLKVDVGDQVAAGQTLFVDRRRPEIAFTAPVDGTVAAIHRGPKRALDALVIGSAGTMPNSPGAVAAVRRGEDARDLLLKSGLWPAFRARPFGRIPDPESMPNAIFVTAMDTNPLAANATVVIAQYAEHFRRGVEALTLLTSGPVYVCQSPGPALVDNEQQRVTCARFDGPHPSGLPGTHIHKLSPVRNGHPVWHIGYQDVIAIGHLLATGTPWTDRVIALAGPGARCPRLVRTKIGASLDDLLVAELNDGSLRIVSGSPLSGRESGFLGRYHTQISVLPQAERLAPLPLLSRLFGVRIRGPQPLFPRAAFEQVMAFDIPPIPLLRALSAKDVETAELLGCTGLIEEDLALLSYVCTSGADYGVLLRSVLDELEGTG